MSRIAQPFGDEESASGRIQRTIEREERHRRKRARTIAGAALLVLAGVVLVSGGLTARALRRPASASANSQSLEEAAALAPQSAPVSPPAAAVATVSKAKELARPAATPKKDVASKKTGSTKPLKGASSANSANDASPQEFAIAIGRVGYEPESITASTGRPITITVGKGEGCAAGFNIPRLGVRADNSSGPATIDLGKVKAGTYIYTCSMGMVSGKLVVR